MVPMSEMRPVHRKGESGDTPGIPPLAASDTNDTATPVSEDHKVPEGSPRNARDGSERTVGFDLKGALNALSDIVNNRPLPLREFDQIYMKVGDMVVYTEFLARLFDGQKLVFVGDGDAIGLSLAHLVSEGVLHYGPSKITVLDFDERMVNSINHFAADYDLTDSIEAVLYNVIDALPANLLRTYDGFHINPPWGQHNDGESVCVFLERGIDLIRQGGSGVVVIADDKSLTWANRVLERTQRAALERGLVVQQMIPALHSYHLDDAPDLRSCSIIFRKITEGTYANEELALERLEDFYGRMQTLRVQYVREIPGLQRGRAEETTYSLELLTKRHQLELLEAPDTRPRKSTRKKSEDKSEKQK
jgi:predicted methyltransferase